MSVRVVIGGRVQGVWFRAWTQQQARQLGLSGWVRNLRDGRVEARFQGPSTDVKEMLQKCKSGPPLSRVEDVSVFPINDDDDDRVDADTFDILPTA